MLLLSTHSNVGILVKDMNENLSYYSIGSHTGSLDFRDDNTIITASVVSYLGVGLVQKLELIN